MYRDSTRILGLDVGEKRIGAALSDPEGILATPLMVIDRERVESDSKALLDLVRQYSVARIVVGLPYSLDGSVGRQAEKVKDFIDWLSQHSEIPVETWDERFSTVAAEHLMVEAGMKRKKRKERVDAMAAALILQSYLDRMRTQEEY